MPATERASGKADNVARQIREMIADGRLAPGHRLLEADVFKAFSVSRSPARRALESLCSDGFLIKHDGQGYVIAGVSEAPCAPRAALSNIGGIANAEARWHTVYPQVEQEITRQILFRNVRVKEEKMAQHFGVSRTVVREVLSQMRAVGLVSKDRSGRWLALRVTAQRIKDLYELRQLLEPAALQIAAATLEPEEIRNLEQLVDQLIKDYPAVEPDQLNFAERALHVEIVVGRCTNQEIAESLKRSQLLLITNHYLLDLFIGVPEKTALVFLKQHRKVIKALGKGKIADAAEALRVHLVLSCKELVGRLDQMAKVPKPDLAPYLVDQS
ncbi:MAG: GntR family transcriptional regulator [Alphaproteobacteria bacterium]|jgi:DNA-binding GntR family transcriptional regulator|nr:GntR family transcriptional regulator [Alphaproteobacteria bacterium]MBT4084696.1 GntR family transcriptional regulator [Alphaproteobacteria bacterium]MBT4544652.1 GntR family transcriptional regulator [Alphaproteobacteria bacterium]MBT7744934.1 GntR family transcriptional regulator [Alphaproteobacteria bacterium]